MKLHTPVISGNPFYPKADLNGTGKNIFNGASPTYLNVVISNVGPLQSIAYKEFSGVITRLTVCNCHNYEIWIDGKLWAKRINAYSNASQIHVVNNTAHITYLEVKKSLEIKAASVSTSYKSQQFALYYLENQ